MYLSLIHTVILVSSFIGPSAPQDHYEAAPIIQYFYWNVDPFYHLPKINPPHGMLHESFKKAEIYCNNNIKFRQNCGYANGTQIPRKYTEFIKVGIGHEVFHKIVLKTNPLDYVNIQTYASECNQSILQIWGVIYMDKSKEWIDENLTGMKTFQLTVSKNVAVIMRRESIDLLNKVLGGIANCLEIVFLSILFALTFGVILWIAEHHSNKDVSGNFLTGCQQTIWCSFVSMTTVGYGDVYPVTVLGRLGMNIWITLGLIMISSMVGIVFDSVAKPPEVHGKRLAVIPNTMSEKFARDSLDGTIINGATNRKIFQHVIDGIADAAIINSDVYAAYQNIFRNDSKPFPLHVVKEFEVNQPVFITFKKYENMTEDGKKLFECLTQTQKELIFDVPVFQHPVKLRIDLIHYTKFTSLSLYLLISMLAMFLLCIIYGFIVGKIKLPKRAPKVEQQETRSENQA